MKENEIWKDVPGWEGLYKVSNFGRCLSVKKNKIKPLDKNSYGYLRLQCYKEGKRAKPFVHQLVAKLFVSGYKEGLVVNHKDGCKQNNMWNNLEWTTRSNNSRHAYALGLQEAKHIKQPCYIEKNGLKVYFETLTSAGKSIGVDGKRLNHLIKTRGGYIPEVDAFIFKCVSND